MGGIDRMNVTPKHLTEISKLILEGAGLSNEQAAAVSSVLVFADERNMWSHGVFRLDSYVNRILKGGVNLTPDVTVNQAARSVIMVDGDHGMGHYASVTAMDEAIRIAKENGSCTAVVRRSGHFGMASAYTAQAAREGQIGIAWTTTSPIIAPWGGREKLLGNNPIAISIPMKDSSPISFDMALSTVAGGKIHAYAERGETIPEGWALDPSGVNTTDPRSALQGSLIPIGTYKGYGLSLMTEAIAVGLASSIFSFESPDLWKEPGKKQSSTHIFIVVNVASLTSLDDFSSTVSRLVERVKESERRNEQESILLPGELEQRNAERSAREGIELPATSVTNVEKAAEAVGVKLNWSES
jgi:L-2-hydroxycarboxylate dehydrogenase (NAD+)